MVHDLFDVFDPVPGQEPADKLTGEGRPKQEDGKAGLLQRLRATAEDLMAHFRESDPDQLERLLEGAGRTYAGASTLHRGYLCPSPLRDIVVDRELRGGPLQDRADNGFEYFWGSDGRLLGCREYRQGKPVQREYLVYRGDRIYGFGYLPSGQPAAVSMERRVQGRLEEYALLTGEPGAMQCFLEDYRYDDQGLESSVQSFYDPQSGTVRQWRYLLEHENGLLTAYYAARSGCPFPTDAQGNCIAHPITVERKA